MNFEWDSEKADANIKKHGITFQNVIPIFADKNRLTALDKRFQYGEERFITFGMIENRLHVVVYTEKNNIVRIISARKANKREQKHYDNR